MDPLLHAGLQEGKVGFFGGVSGEKFGLCECFDVCSSLDGGIDAHRGGGGGLANGSGREKEGGGVWLGIHVKGGK